MCSRFIVSPLIGLAIAIAIIAGSRADTQLTPGQIPRGAGDVTKAIASEYTLDAEHKG